MDIWDQSWTEQKKRTVVADGIEMQRRKGTVWAVRQALYIAGYPDADVTEGSEPLLRDGTVNHNGQDLHGYSRWSCFHVDLMAGTQSAEALAMVRQVIDRTAPARCGLKTLTSSEA